MASVRKASLKKRLRHPDFGGMDMVPIQVFPQIQGGPQITFSVNLWASPNLWEIIQGSSGFHGSSSVSRAGLGCLRLCWPVGSTIRVQPEAMKCWSPWTAAACCRFRQASPLAVECSRTIFRHRVFAFASAERFLRESGASGGSRLPQSMVSDSSSTLKSPSSRPGAPACSAWSFARRARPCPAPSRWWPQRARSRSRKASSEWPS